MDTRPLTRRGFCAGCAVAAACAPADPVYLGTDSDTGSGPTGGTEPGLRDEVCAEPVPTGGGLLTLPLSDWPALASVGGWVSVASGAGQLIVARVAADCVVAMVRACTHEGVPIEYKAGRTQFVCPRHGAVYDWDGSKISGPQPTGLPTFPAGIDGDTVYVDVS